VVFACTSIVAGWGGWRGLYVTDLLWLTSFFLTCDLRGILGEIGVSDCCFYGAHARQTGIENPKWKMAGIEERNEVHTTLLTHPLEPALSV
jgi:hypothetical protein